MIIAAILAQKGREVITIGPERTIAEAVAVLAARRIGAIVVVDAGRIRGIISERDIVRALSRSGPEALSGRISEIMTRDVVTCLERETINDVMGRMTRGRFRHLPVVENGELVGMISIGDVVKARIEEAEREAAEMRSYIAST
jgi:CBS domain-containing protein